LAVNPVLAEHHLVLDESLVARAVARLEPL
jgi:hypothetical protein